MSYYLNFHIYLTSEIVWLNKKTVHINFNHKNSSCDWLWWWLPPIVHIRVFYREKSQYIKLWEMHRFFMWDKICWHCSVIFVAQWGKQPALISLLGESPLMRGGGGIKHCSSRYLFKSQEFGTCLSILRKTSQKGRNN